MFLVGTVNDVVDDDGALTGGTECTAAQAPGCSKFPNEAEYFLIPFEGNRLGCARDTHQKLQRRGNDSVDIL